MNIRHERASRRPTGSLRIAAGAATHPIEPAPPAPLQAGLARPAEARRTRPATAKFAHVQPHQRMLNPPCLDLTGKPPVGFMRSDSNPCGLNGVERPLVRCFVGHCLAVARKVAKPTLQILATFFDCISLHAKWTSASGKAIGTLNPVLHLVAAIGQELSMPSLVGIRGLHVELVVCRH